MKEKQIEKAIRLFGGKEKVAALLKITPEKIDDFVENGVKNWRMGKLIGAISVAKDLDTIEVYIKKFYKDNRDNMKHLKKQEIIDKAVLTFFRGLIQPADLAALRERLKNLRA